MNKKILIGSIIAVTVILLSSFTSVVASQSITQSDVLSKIKLIKNNPDRVQELLKVISLNSQNPKNNNIIIIVFV